jgi:hypothetical protein
MAALKLHIERVSMQVSQLNLTYCELYHDNLFLLPAWSAAAACTLEPAAAAGTPAGTSASPLISLFTLSRWLHHNIAFQPPN